jgi:hypothetical protein
VPRRRRLARLVSAFAAIATLGPLIVPAACRKPADPVRDVLDVIAAAAGKRDADAILKRISPDFRDQHGGTRAEVEQTVRRALAAYDSLSVSLSGVTIDRKEKEAWASFRADLSGTPTKLGALDAWLPRSSSFRFDVRLVEEDSGWNVVWAAWTRAE